MLLPSGDKDTSDHAEVHRADFLDSQQWVTWLRCKFPGLYDRSLITVFICICVCTHAHNVHMCGRGQCWVFLSYSAPCFSRQGSTESGAHKLDKTSWLVSSKDSFSLPQDSVIHAPRLGVLESQFQSAGRAGTLMTKAPSNPLNLYF